MGRRDVFEDFKKIKTTRNKIIKSPCIVCLIPALLCIYLNADVGERSLDALSDAANASGGNAISHGVFYVLCVRRVVLRDESRGW